MDSGDTKVLDVEVNHPRGFDFLTHLLPPTSPSVTINEHDDITSTHYSLFFVDNELEGVYKKWFDHNLNPVTDVIPVRTNQEDPRQVRAYPRYEGKQYVSFMKHDLSAGVEFGLPFPIDRES
jgi:hypothetical protein